MMYDVYGLTGSSEVFLRCEFGDLVIGHARKSSQHIAQVSVDVDAAEFHGLAARGNLGSGNIS